MDFHRLVEIDLAHEGAAILLDLEKANIFQGAKCLSDRTAADTEAFGDLLFCELLTSGKLPLENPFGDGALHVEGTRTGDLRFSVLGKGYAHLSTKKSSQT